MGAMRRKVDSEALRMLMYQFHITIEHRGIANKYRHGWLKDAKKMCVDRKSKHSLTFRRGLQVHIEICAQVLWEGEINSQIPNQPGCGNVATIEPRIKL